jgi:hypothetical protein
MFEVDWSIHKLVNRSIWTGKIIIICPQHDTANMMLGDQFKIWELSSTRRPKK